MDSKQVLIKRKANNRISLDFSDYHFIRQTNIFFRCNRCPFEVELQNWLFTKAGRKWCLHLDKFHKCGAETTKRCSKQVLPPYAKKWPTISNDTAKRLLQAGLLTKASEAPQPLPNVVPLQLAYPIDTGNLKEDTLSADTIASDSNLSNSYDAASVDPEESDIFDSLLEQLDFSPFE